MKPDDIPMWAWDKAEEVMDGHFPEIQFDIARALIAARAEGMEMAAGEARDMRPGLSAWEGWDQSRLPWSECKHKDAVLEALFERPWSMEDADALIGFIDRTWGPAAIRTAALDMRRGERE